MDLPFVTVLCVQTSTQRSAGPRTGPKCAAAWALRSSRYESVLPLPKEDAAGVKFDRSSISRQTASTTLRSCIGPAPFLCKSTWRKAWVTSFRLTAPVLSCSDSEAACAVESRRRVREIPTAARTDMRLNIGAGSLE